MTIFQHIKTKLKQPHPCDFTWSEAWKRALAFGLFVTFFLGYFKPFGLVYAPQQGFWIVVSMFGVITFGAILFNFIALPRFFKNFFKEEQWTVKHEIIFTLYSFVFIGTLNFFYFAYLNQLPFQVWIKAFAGLQIGTLAVGAAPVILFTLYDQNKQLRKHLQQASDITDHITTDQQTSHTQEADQVEIVISQLEFKAENGNTELIINADQFLYVQSAGNYLDIHYVEDGQLQKTVVRNRLKNVITVLSDSIFYQCHRSYIVNLSKVQHVSGNARGLFLHLDQCSETVPVSRGKSKEVADLLEKSSIMA